ncbi:MAG: family 20 glycosylhydrolase [Micrococcales bacterium]|nr:family 20 glycosylhydrolase [Micrococcales bacterium]
MPPNNIGAATASHPSGMRRRGGAGHKTLSTLIVGALSLGMVSFGSLSAQAADTESVSTAVIPALHEWTDTDGTTSLTATSRIVFDAAQGMDHAVAYGDDINLTKQTVSDLARGFAADLAKVNGLKLAIATGTPRTGDIVLTLVDTKGSPEDTASEGYNLTIEDGKVSITANTTAGLYYGTRTVMQSLSVNENHKALANGYGIDKPDAQIRMNHIDVSREYWEPQSVYDNIVQMGWTKQNMLKLHFDDAEAFRLDSPKFPGLGEKGWSYDEAQIRKFVELGKAHNVTIIPGFEFPAHVSAKASYFHIGMDSGPLDVEWGYGPRDTGATLENTCPAQAATYGHLRPDFTLNFMNEKAMRYSKMVLDEFVPWFDSPYVHIGGDEVPPNLANVAISPLPSACPALRTWLEDPNNPLRTSASTVTVADVEAWFINELDDHLNAMGKETIVFNGFENTNQGNHPNQTVRDRVIVQWWTGSGTPSTTRLEPYRTIVGNNGGSYYLVTPRGTYPNPAIYTSASILDSPTQTTPRTMGMSSFVWGDDGGWYQGQYIEQIYYLQRAMIAARSWNKSIPNETLAQFKVRLNAVGPAPSYVGAIDIKPTTHGRPIHDWVGNRQEFPPGTFDAHSGAHRRGLYEKCGLSGMTPLTSGLSRVNDPVKGNVPVMGSGHFNLGAPEIYGAWTLSATLMVPTTAAASVPILDSRNWGAEKLVNGRLVIVPQTSVSFSLPTSREVGITDAGVARSFGVEAPRGVWVQIVFVTDGTTTKLYFDGELQGTINYSVKLPRAMMGLASTVRFHSMQIYAQALTDAQVKEQVTKVPQVACQPLVGKSFDQDLEVTVKPGKLTLEVPRTQTVNFGSVTLTGSDQFSTAALNSAIVNDARGTNEGWTLTGAVTDFTGDENARKILGGNLGWSPWATVDPLNDEGLIHEVPTGPAVNNGAVAPGSAVAPAQNDGLSVPKTLCSGSVGYSTGRFTCGADLRLGIPWSTPADHYVGVLTLTLI